METLKHVPKSDLVEAVLGIHAIYGEVVLPDQKVEQAFSLVIWVESFEDEDTVYSLLDKEGEVIFETRLS